MVSRGFKLAIIFFGVIAVGIGIALAAANASARSKVDSVNALNENWNKRIDLCYEMLNTGEPETSCDEMITDKSLDCQAYDFMLDVCSNGRVEQYMSDRTR